MKQNKTLIHLLVVGLAALFVGVVLLFSYSSSYNSLQTYDTSVDHAWSNVESYYQRRYDLIPALLPIVKAAAIHEKDIIDAIAKAHASMGRPTLDIKTATSADVDQFQSSQMMMTGLLNRMMVATQNYPELKANDQFLNLSAEIAGSENRINIARIKFNDSVLVYNNRLRQIPTNIVAFVAGMQPRPYFKAKANPDEMPKISL